MIDYNILVLIILTIEIPKISYAISFIVSYI